MNADTERAIRSAYQCYATACFEHDCEHAQRAARVLRDLLPEQRVDVDRSALLARQQGASSADTVRS